LCRIDGVVAGVLHPEPEAHLHVIGGEIGGVIDVDVDEVFDGATGDGLCIGDRGGRNREGDGGFESSIENDGMVVLASAPDWSVLAASVYGRLVKLMLRSICSTAPCTLARAAFW